MLRLRLGVIPCEGAEAGLFLCVSGLRECSEGVNGVNGVNGEKVIGRFFRVWGGSRGE